VAEERRQFEAAEAWYRKSLAIEEKQGNEHGAASTYGQLGLLALRRGQLEAAASWLIRCAKAFTHTHDPMNVERTRTSFVLLLSEAPEDLRPRLRALWTEAGLPPPRDTAV
jgi:hypothetical protein